MNINQQLERRKSHLKNLNEKIKIEKNEGKKLYFEKIKNKLKLSIKKLEIKKFMQDDPYINEFEK